MNMSKILKKIAFNMLKPFLPFIIIILALFFAICTVIDAIFIQEVQSNDSSMSEVQLEIKNLCIEKAEFLNTCDNYIGSEHTTYILDSENRETTKMIEWSHLYAIMAFHNMTDNTKINADLLNKVANSFKSTFIYEKTPIKVEITVIDENGNTTIETQEEYTYVLVESNTIMGHYKYHYQERSVENGNMKITQKIFTNEELISKKYERLENYLKKNLHIRESDIENSVETVIQAANGYYHGEENVAWLQGSLSSSIITDGKSLVPTGMFIWPTPGYTKITSPFGMRTHPVTGAYKLHTGTDIAAPTGANFIAMADGTVVKAGYNTAYGNMVMIEHGNGIVTLYAHGSEILVKTNQVAVLKVGSTGYSTGPHAHFDVIINGSYSNPENYFEKGD